MDKKLDIHDSLLGGEDFATLAKQVKEDYGTSADGDNPEKNEKLQAYLDGFGEVNFYTCMMLLILSPEEFDSFRSKAKMFLLPAFQILVPLGMIYFFIIGRGDGIPEHAGMVALNGGYCCPHENIIFRVTGFVGFMYSGWQIIDGSSDSSSGFLLVNSCSMWSISGNPTALKATFMFYLCYLSQQLCSILLLVLTYVIFTSQCDTPLDLLMNCVAINFVLDIDSEWMDDTKQGKSKDSAVFLFTEYRDQCMKDEAGTKENLKKFQTLRKAAPAILKLLCNVCEWGIVIAVYLLVFGWTFCPKSWNTGQPA